MIALLLILGCLPGDADRRGETGDSSADDLVAPATEGTFQADFSLDAEGEGSERLGAFAVEGNRVTLAFDGAAHRGLAWQRHDWVDSGYVLYDLLTVAEDGSELAVSYLYELDGGLPWVYTEGFAHPMALEEASGTAAGLAQSSAVQASIPALRTLPPPFSCGIAIEGQDLWLAGSAGGIAVGGATWDLLPFAGVDCTDCPGGPWLEIHSLLAGDGEACFGIVYLFPDEPSEAQLSYGLCLPTLTTLEGDFEVSWSGSLARVQGRPWPRPGRPPRPRVR
jgi:hypothetical protein